MDLDRRRGKNGQVGWIWKNVCVSYYSYAWVGDVEPVGHLPIGDEVNSTEPRSVLLKRAKVVSQLVVITVAIGAVASRAIILQGEKARPCKGAIQEFLATYTASRRVVCRLAVAQRQTSGESLRARLKLQPNGVAAVHPRDNCINWTAPHNVRVGSPSKVVRRQQESTVGWRLQESPDVRGSNNAKSEGGHDGRPAQCRRCACKSV